jgi:hypothetical protein
MRRQGSGHVVRIPAGQASRQELTVRPPTLYGKRATGGDLRARRAKTASWKARTLFAAKWLRGLDFVKCYTIPMTYWIDLIRR